MLGRELILTGLFKIVFIIIVLVECEYSLEISLHTENISHCKPYFLRPAWTSGSGTSYPQLSPVTANLGE